MMLNLLLFTLLSCAVNGMRGIPALHEEEIGVNAKLSRAGLITQTLDDNWITIKPTAVSEAFGINFAKQETTADRDAWENKIQEIVANKKVYLIKGYGPIKEADLQKPLAEFNHAEDAAKRILVSGAEIIAWDGDDAKSENFLGRILQELPKKTPSGKPWKFIFMNFPGDLNDSRRPHRKSLNAFFSRDFIADMLPGPEKELSSCALSLFPKGSEIYGFFMDDTEIMRPYHLYDEANAELSDPDVKVAHFAKIVRKDHYLYRSSKLGEMLYNIINIHAKEIEVLALGGGPVVCCEYVLYLRALGNKFHAYPTTREEGARHGRQPMLFDLDMMRLGLGASPLNPAISPVNTDRGLVRFFKNVWSLIRQGCQWLLKMLQNALTSVLIGRSRWPLLSRQQRTPVPSTSPSSLPSTSGSTMPSTVLDPSASLLHDSSGPRPAL